MTFLTDSTRRIRHHPGRTGIWALLGRVRALRRQRRALASLEPHLLEDIGLTAADAGREARRPLWDAPENWYL